MYSQYGINSSSKIKIKYINDLLIKAVRSEQEAWAWEMWLILWPRMTKETFKSFEDYKKDLFKPQVKVSAKSSQEIVDEFKLIIAQHEGITHKLPA